MGLAEMPDAARLAKQLVAAYGNSAEDTTFSDLVFEDALAEAFAAGTAQLPAQTIAELARLTRLAIYLAADACESTVEITTGCLLRHYDDWLERSAAHGGRP